MVAAVSTHSLSLFPDPPELFSYADHLSDLGGVKQKLASWAMSHKVGETGCSFDFHFPPWEKSQAERISPGTELCCPWGSVIKVKLFFLPSSMHLFIDILLQ